MSVLLEPSTTTRAMGARSLVPETKRRKPVAVSIQEAHRNRLLYQEGRRVSTWCRAKPGGLPSVHPPLARKSGSRWGLNLSVATRIQQDPPQPAPLLRRQPAVPKAIIDIFKALVEQQLLAGIIRVPLDHANRGLESLEFASHGVYRCCKKVAIFVNSGRSLSPNRIRRFCVWYSS
jgi:hypothetical protein